MGSGSRTTAKALGFPLSALALKAARHESVGDWRPIGRIMAEPGANRLSVCQTPAVAQGQLHPPTKVPEAEGAPADEGRSETMFTKLDLGRVDLVAAADVGGMVTLMRFYPEWERHFPFTDFFYSAIAAGLHAVDTLENRDLPAAFRAGLARITTDGSSEKLQREFFGEEHWRRVRVP